LLQLQYEGLAIMQMFGRAKINVNLLIYLINKKFYGRVLWFCFLSFFSLIVKLYIVQM